MKRHGEGLRGPDVGAEAVRRIAGNAAALLLAYVLPRGLTFAAVVLAARVLGAADFGAYGTAAAFAVVMSVLASLGMVPMLVRDIARDPASAPRLVRAAHGIKTVAGAGMLAALLLLARGLGYSAEVTAAALLLGLGYWLASYADNLSAYFQGVERMRVCTEASAAFGLVAGALGALLVLATRSLVWYSAAFAMGHAAALLWLVVRAPAEVRWGAPGGAGEIRKLAGETLPFAAAFVALTVHYKVDVLVLERLRAPEDVGLYVAAYKFVDVFHALVLVGVAALFPRLSRASASPAGANGGRWVGTRAAELVLLVAVPAAGVLWLLRDAAVGLFGEGYAGSAAALVLLAPALPALALNLYGGYVLGAARRMGWVALLYAVAVPVKVLGLAAAAPRWGAAGGAGAVLATEVGLALAFGVVLARVAGAAPGWKALGIAAGGAALAWPAAAAPLPGGAPGAAAAYLLAVISLYAVGGALSAGEVRAVRQALAPSREGALGAEGVP